MSKSRLWLLMLLLFVFVMGCSNGNSSELNNESSNKDTNQVEIVVKNSTNVDWVMEKTSYGSEEYRGELDAIYAKDFVVKAGEVFFSTSGNANDYVDNNNFEETSNTTYEYKIQLIAGGPMPTDPDEQYVYDPFSSVVDFIVKGTYGKTVTIEWDGEEFKQVD